MATETTQAVQEIFDIQASPSTMSSLTNLARSYVSLRDKIDAAEVDLSQLKQQREVLEMTLVDKLAEAKLKSIRLTDNVLMTSTLKTDYRLPGDEAQRKRVLRWIGYCRGKSIIKQDVHWSRFQAFCCERRDAGKYINDEVQQTERKGISVRKT